MFRTKIMAPGSITSWQIDGEIMETVTDFTFLHSKVTADGDCSHEIMQKGINRNGLRADLGPKSLWDGGWGREGDVRRI